MDEKTIIEFEKLNGGLTKTGRTRSQIGKGSKTKGKTGERYFADILTELSGMSFIRTSNSGAFCGQSNRERLKTISRAQGHMTLGDIICPEELKWNLIFEAKNYAELEFHQLLNLGGSAKLLGWLDEMLYDAESAVTFMPQSETIGLLCVKITRRGSWIIYNQGLLTKKWQKPFIARDNSSIGYCIPYPHLTFAHRISSVLSAVGWNSVFEMTDFRNFCTINKEFLFDIKAPF